MSVFANERAHKFWILSNSHVLTALTCVFTFVSRLHISSYFFFFQWYYSFLFCFVLIFQFRIFKHQNHHKYSLKYQMMTMNFILLWKWIFWATNFFFPFSRWLLLTWSNNALKSSDDSTTTIPSNYWQFSNQIANWFLLFCVFFSSLH